MRVVFALEKTGLCLQGHFPIMRYVPNKSGILAMLSLRLKVRTLYVFQLPILYSMYLFVEIFEFDTNFPTSLCRKVFLYVSGFLQLN